MQAVTFRARVAAPVGLTARVARAHTAKAFAAPRTKVASKRPVVLVRAAEGASSLHKPRTDRKKAPVKQPRRRSLPGDDVTITPLTDARLNPNHTHR